MRRRRAKDGSEVAQTGRQMPHIIFHIYRFLSVHTCRVTLAKAIESKQNPFRYRKSVVDPYDVLHPTRIKDSAESRASLSRAFDTRTLAQ